MSLGDRCDEIVRLIDETLAECAAAAAGTAAVVAGQPGPPLASSGPDAALALLAPGHGRRPRPLAATRTSLFGRNGVAPRPLVPPEAPGPVDEDERAAAGF